MAKNPIVTIKMADGGVMKLELYPDIAPKTVENFVSLVEKKFYDGLIFHRVIKGFMIQGGDPEGTGMGGPGYSIPGEFSSNGFENNLKHTEGVISMARAKSPDSASSQFFIVHQDSEFLDGSYAAFGAVTEGIEIVDAIFNDSFLRWVLGDEQGFWLLKGKHHCCLLIFLRKKNIKILC